MPDQPKASLVTEEAVHRRRGYKKDLVVDTLL